MYKAALGQTTPKTADIKHNLGVIEENIAEAAAQGCRLIIFAELALSGYNCGDRFFQVAETIPGPSTNALAEIAKDKGIYIICGMPERGLRGLLYNSAAVIGPEGVLGSWRKHTLPGHATDDTGPGAFPDRRFFRAGTENPVFDTDIGRIGVMVCYDTFFPEIARLLCLKGVDLLVAISGSPDFEKGFFEDFVRARAMENTLWTAYCNLGGREGETLYWGGSRVIAPGDPATKLPGSPVVVKAPYNKSALVTAEIDHTLAHRFRPLFPVLRDIPLDIYRELEQAGKSLG